MLKDKKEINSRQSDLGCNDFYKREKYKTKKTINALSVSDEEFFRNYVENQRDEADMSKNRKKTDATNKKNCLADLILQLWI